MVSVKSVVCFGLFRELVVCSRSRVVIFWRSVCSLNDICGVLSRFGEGVFFFGVFILVDVVELEFVDVLFIVFFGGFVVDVVVVVIWIGFFVVCMVVNIVV